MKEAAQETTDDIVKRELVFHIGGFSNQLQATTEAKDFMKPNVFQYRSAIFPDPRNFHLDITPVSAEVKAWPKPPSPMNTIYIEQTLEVEGAGTQIDEWERRVLRAIKAFMPTSWGTTTDRSEHLKDTERPDPMAKGVQAPIEGAGLGGDRSKHMEDRGMEPYPKEGAKQEDKSSEAPTSTLEGLD